MATSFIPKGQEELLLPNPLAQSYTSPDYHSKSLLYSRNVRSSLTGSEADILEDGSTSRRLGVYTRHNPHPVRVRHMKGILDSPICMVEDNIERRILWSAPSGENFSTSFRPPGSTRYSANRSKHLASVGIVPVTYAWKDELEKKTHNAITKALGQTPVPMSRQSQRGMEKKEYDGIEDNELLDLLCHILQTDSIPVCQAWLQSASDTEKTIVLNMMRMAAAGEVDPFQQESRNHTRPHTSESQYVWNPVQRSSHPPHVERPTVFEQSQSVEGRFNTPFKLPKHDTIIRSAHSRFSFREPQKNFHERLQNELDQAEMKSSQHPSKSRRNTTSLQNRPNSAEIIKRPFSHHGTRPRSRSVGLQMTKEDHTLSPTPMRVTVRSGSHRPGSRTLWSRSK